MTKTVISIRCADVEQYERIKARLEDCASLTKRLSKQALGHEVTVHMSDVVEDALIVNKARMENAAALQEERAG